MGPDFERDWQRALHEPIFNSEFANPFDQPGWRHFSWGDPTRMGGHPSKPADLGALVEHLRKTKGPILFFPENQFLEVLLQRPSTLPLLWFHPGLTFSKVDSRGMDERIVRELEAKKVEILVIETHPFLALSWTTGYFPGFTRWMATHFEFEANFGPFRVLRKRK